MILSLFSTQEPPFPISTEEDTLQLRRLVSLGPCLILHSPAQSQTSGSVEPWLTNMARSLVIPPPAVPSMVQTCHSPTSHTGQPDVFSSELRQMKNYGGGCGSPFGHSRNEEIYHKILWNLCIQNMAWHVPISITYGLSGHVTWLWTWPN